MLDIIVEQILRMHGIAGKEDDVPEVIIVCMNNVLEKVLYPTSS
jgi:hypothetical protein